MHERCFRTVYRFGSLTKGHHGYLVLRPDHRVGYYRNPNEAEFRLDETRLKFLHVKGATTGSLIFHPDANCFLPDGGKGLYLLPVIELEADDGAPAPARRLLINTVPKSGTYFLEAAAGRLAFRPTRLHLGARLCDDFRGVPDAEMHIAPERYRVEVPAGAIAQIMVGGEIAVGHIPDHNELDAIADAGVTLLHCVRDLRNVLVSLFRFKRRVVRPTSSADTVWRALPEPQSFLAFLAFAANRDIANIEKIATAIAKRPEPRVHFEDMIDHQRMPVLRAALGKMGDSFADAFASSIDQVRGSPTSTLSGSLTEYKQIWSDDAQAFFVSSGLARINRLLGYVD
jgi:hypothetical protein